MQMKQPRLLGSSAGRHNCVEIRKRASDYLEAAISEEEKEHIGGHVGRCGDCRRFLETLRTTIGMLHDLSERAIPESLKDRLLQVPRNQGQGQA